MAAAMPENPAPMTTTLMGRKFSTTSAFIAKEAGTAVAQLTLLSIWFALRCNSVVRGRSDSWQWTAHDLYFNAKVSASVPPVSSAIDTYTR